MDVHVGRCSGVLECLLDVGPLEVRILLQDLIEGPAGDDQTDHGLHGDAQPSDAGPAFELVGLDSDSVERHRFLSARSCADVGRGSRLSPTLLCCARCGANPPQSHEDLGSMQPVLELPPITA